MIPPAAGSMPDWLQQRAASTPGRLALLCGDDRVTFAELDAAVDAVARRLASQGVKPGEVVGILGRNSTGFVLVVHALARLGAVLMPLNVRLTASELAWQVQDAGVHRLVCDEAQRDAARAVRDVVAPLQLIEMADIVDTLTPALSLEGEGVGPEGREGGRYELKAAHSIIYTSGTTGRPKGAMLTYGNHLWSAIGSALNLGLREDDRWLACLPLFHVGGLAILLRSVIYGTAAVVHPGFDAARVNQAIENDGITIISVVANMLHRMLDERGDVPYPASLRCVLLGGGPAPAPLLRRCASLGVPVVQTYGLTEAASQVATLAPEDALPRLGSAGKALFGTAVRIVAPDGSESPAGTPGEIAVSGPTVTPGYLNRPEETAQAIRGGWLYTGDIGQMGEDGYLYVLDRRDDLIVSGGENVYPAEVEAVLQAHADVLEAGVFGVPDERWGQAPVAAVVLREGASVTTEGLLAFCRERLAPYKTPSRIEVRGKLPRNAAGKLVRSELRDKGPGTGASRA